MPSRINAASMPQADMTPYIGMVSPKTEKVGNIVLLYVPPALRPDLSCWSILDYIISGIMTYCHNPVAAVIAKAAMRITIRIEMIPATRPTMLVT